MSPSGSQCHDLAGSINSMGYAKSSININLANHFRSKVYTSSSPVSGTVTITTRQDVRFDDVQISLVGNSRTRVEGMSSTQEVTHSFLKMAMPIPESTYPLPRIFRAGQTYSIPFEFVIPNYLTVNACNHKNQSAQLLDQHVLLPPTMGSWEKDDMSPQMARVEYAVKARVYRQPDLNRPSAKVMEASQTIRVLPTSAEEPPLDLSKRDRLYTMEKSKTLRKGLLSGKLGRLTAEALQPGAVFVQPDGRAVSGTAAQMELTFAPTSVDTLPPQVTGVTGKLVAHTYYSGSGINTFPNLGDWTRDSIAQLRGTYSTSTSIPAISVPRTRWVQHLSSDARRDSGYSTQAPSQDGYSDSDYDEDEKKSHRGRRSGKEKTKAATASPIYHTTTLRVPINLGLDKKMIIPTFHSCITSRFYTLQLSVSLSSGSTSHSVNLSVPLQVAVASDLEHGLGLPSFEAAVEEAAADEYLEPRVIRVPDFQHTERSRLIGYGELATVRG